MCLCISMWPFLSILFLMAFNVYVCVWLTVVPVGCDSVTECADPLAGPASLHFSSVPLGFIHLQLCIYLTFLPSGKICLSFLNFLSFYILKAFIAINHSTILVSHSSSPWEWDSSPCRGQQSELMVLNNCAWIVFPSSALVLYLLSGERETFWLFLSEKNK